MVGWNPSKAVDVEISAQVWRISVGGIGNFSCKQLTQKTETLMSQYWNSGCPTDHYWNTYTQKEQNSGISHLIWLWYKQVKTTLYWNELLSESTKIAFFMTCLRGHVSDVLCPVIKHQNEMLYIQLNLGFLLKDASYNNNLITWMSFAQGIFLVSFHFFPLSPWQQNLTVLVEIPCSQSTIDQSINQCVLS